MKSMEHGTFLRLAGLLALYFIGYLWLVPQLAIILTLAIDPQAELINTYVLTCLYVIIIVLSMLLTKRQWKESLQKILKKPVSSVFKILFGAVCVLLLNVVLSMVCAVLSGQVNSVNQEVIRDNVTAAPLYMMFTTMVFAPIVEESVFRGGIFAYCRKYLGFFWSAMISALAFGAIHVMDSIIAGNWSDVIFLIVYAGIGAANAWYYEHYEGIASSAGIHFLNNMISYLAI